MAISTYDLIAKELKAETAHEVNPLVSSVGTTVTQILREDPSRLMYVIVNLGAYDMFIAYDRQVSSTRGIKVAAGGGTFISWWKEDGRLVCLPVFGVAPGGTTAIFVSVEKLMRALP